MGDRITDNQEFTQAAEKVRREFTYNMTKDDWWVFISPEKRVQIENILIMYDQMVYRLKQTP